MLYQDYMRYLILEEFGESYITEEELSDDVEDNVAEEPSGKKMYIENYYLRDHLQAKYVSPKLKKTSVQDQLLEFTGGFIDAHHNEFNTAGPVYMIGFGKAETSVLYSIFDIDKDTLMQIYNNMVAETYPNGLRKSLNGMIVNAPHKILLTCILIDALQNNYEDMVACMEYLWAFSEYPILLRHFWKIDVKPDLMDYTIEHLGNKFQVKKEMNLLGLLKYDSTKAVEAMKDKLITGADNTYIDISQSIRNRIQSKFRNIANAYFENDKQNATQHSKTTQFDDGSLADQDGMTTNIATIVDKTINKYVSGDINNSLAGVVAEANKIDKNNLLGYISQINSSKNNMVAKFIENVITIYFMKNPSANGIESSNFVSFGLSLYRSISMSKDEMYKTIRAILDHWMFEIINIRESYQREATVISYTRAIYNYMILMINYYN